MLRAIDYGGARPIADLTLRPRLRAPIDAALAELDLSQLARDDPLWLGKEALGNLSACEEFYLQESTGDFDWSTATAVGTVAHTAIRLRSGGHPGPPVTLVEAALDVLINGGGDAKLQAFLSALTAAARADLVSRVVTPVETFWNDWPLHGPETGLRAEVPYKLNLANGRIVVSTKVDLVLGHGRGSPSGVVREALFVELKTGGLYLDEHRADGLFTALLSVLRGDVAPYRVMTWYLDSGDHLEDEPNEDALAAANLRLIDAIAKAVGLANGRAPVRRGGLRCRYCPLEADCPAADRARRRAS